MKTIKIILLVLGMLTIKLMNSNSQNVLTIEITGLRNNNGQILLQLMDENKNNLKSVHGIIKENKCIMMLEDLKTSKYAFRYFHDENKNNKLDTKWLGIPVEGFGFSNNAKGTFGPPSFEKWIFDLKANTAIKCNPTYYL